MEYHVYVVEPTLDYSGGCCVVTARSEAEARDFLVHHPNDWTRVYFEPFTAENGTEYPIVERLEGVETQLTECRILTEKIYVE